MQKSRTRPLTQSERLPSCPDGRRGSSGSSEGSNTYKSGLAGQGASRSPSWAKMTLIKNKARDTAHFGTLEFALNCTKHLKKAVQTQRTGRGLLSSVNVGDLG